MAQSEMQFFLNIAFAIAGTLSGWIVHTVWDAQKMLREDLQEIEKSIPQVYARRDDLKDLSKEIKEMLHKILDKLEQKQDKEKK
ncbi:hypothetical protein EBT16_08555 [bacterium]|nr:hypothetical protein [bacterium]